MKSMDDNINAFLSKRGPTSERAHLIQRICDTLFSKKEFVKILGQTKLLTLDEIEEIFSQAKNWNVNPQALFWKLLKEKNGNIKKDLE